MQKELTTALRALLASEDEAIRLEAVKLALGVGTRIDESRKRASRRWYLRTRIKELEASGENPEKLAKYKEQLENTEKFMKWQKREPEAKPISAAPEPSPEDQEAERAKMAEHAAWAKQFLADLEEKDNG